MNTILSGIVGAGRGIGSRALFGAGVGAGIGMLRKGPEEVDPALGEYTNLVSNVQQAAGGAIFGMLGRGLISAGVRTQLPALHKSYHAALKSHDSNFFMKALDEKPRSGPRIRRQLTRSESPSKVRRTSSLNPSTKPKSSPKIRKARESSRKPPFQKVRHVFGQMNAHMGKYQDKFEKAARHGGSRGKYYIELGHGGKFGRSITGLEPKRATGKDPLNITVQKVDKLFVIRSKEQLARMDPSIKNYFKRTNQERATKVLDVAQEAAGEIIGSIPGVVGGAAKYMGKTVKQGYHNMAVKPYVKDAESLPGYAKANSLLNPLNGGIAAAGFLGIGAISMNSAFNYTAAYSGQGHPLNAMRAARAGANATGQQEHMQSMSMIMMDPGVAGFSDYDNAYAYNSSLAGSSSPMSRGQARLAEKNEKRRNGIVAGQFGDTGDLVFAMHTLRSGGR